MVVLPEKVTPELVEELWTVLGEHAGVVPVLEVLTGSFGASLASLPPFAIAVADGRQVQVASRGATSVTVARPDGRDHVSGEGVTTWAERTFSDVVDLAVQVGVTESDQDLLDERALPLDAGVVLVSSVGVRLTHDARPAAAAPRGAPVAEPWESEPKPAAPQPAAPQPAGDGPATPEATIAPEATMVPSLTVTGDDVPRPADDLSRPADDDADGDAAAVGGAPAPVAALGGGPLAALGTGEQDSPGTAAAEPPLEETTGYGHLWGSTVHRAVEAAAVRPEPEAEDEEAAETPASAGPADAASAPVPSPAPAAPETGGTVDRPGEATVAEPAEPEPSGPSEPAPATPEGTDDDIDGSTVMSSAIADLRAVAPDPAVAEPVTAGAPADAVGAQPAVAPPGPSFAAAPLPGRPMILARSCTSGHPNPPQRDSCATCGQSLVGEARQVPRPTLGMMAVSSGPRVTLDRPVVIGRRPRSPRSAGGDLPRLITVPSPEQDISRSHVEIRLEGWHVLVSDMSTTNGTTLLRSGQAPLRLHPGEPVLVVSGDVVDLGDGVTLTFEGIL